MPTPAVPFEHPSLVGAPRGAPLPPLSERFARFRHQSTIAWYAWTYQRASCVSWMRLPQVSSNMAMVEPVTWVGGMVNLAP
jgi:hypothetical protein